ncbi:MAG: helix-turn-helix domain-containing protein [Erysipelotrichaceae bacterium]|nr:helix-turn-helix domain-containing protein [Erysipelotrichaceae bacterium]
MKFEDIITTKEVADILHCSKHQVGYLWEYGLIAGTRFDKYWLFDRKEIKELFERSKGKDYSNFREMTPEAARKKYLDK